MAAPIRPAASKAFGKTKFIFVPTIANTAAPTVAELTAVAALDISCFLFDSFGRPTQSTNKVELERRVCDTVQFEQIGVTKYSGAELVYAIDPQSAAASNGKKAFEKLVAGATGYLVERDGIDVNTDVATGQFVNVWPVELGPSLPAVVGSGESAENAMSCSYAITSAPALVKAVV